VTRARYLVSADLELRAGSARDAEAQVRDLLAGLSARADIDRAYVGEAERMDAVESGYRLVKERNAR
jgi:hypothetical protein